MKIECKVQQPPSGTLWGHELHCFESLVHLSANVDISISNKILDLHFKRKNVFIKIFIKQFLNRAIF